MKDIIAGVAEAHGAYSLNWKPRAAIGLPIHVKSRRKPKRVDEYSVDLPVAHRAGSYPASGK